MKNKALRKFSQIDVSKDKSMPKVVQRIENIRPFNFNNAKMMIQSFKKEVEHIHLKHKPHHHKRTSPGSLDSDNPHTMTGHENMDKTMRVWKKAAAQKSSDLSKKYFKRDSWKKAA